MHANLFELHSKNYIFATRSVYCLRKNIELVQKLFFLAVEKIIKHFAEKSFRVFNRTPSDTIKVLFGKIIYYYFSTSMKYVFCINSRNLFRQYTDVVKKISFIL